MKENKMTINQAMAIVAILLCGMITGLIMVAVGSPRISSVGACVCLLCMMIFMILMDSKRGKCGRPDVKDFKDQGK